MKSQQIKFLLLLLLPKIGNYGASVPAESNSFCDQAKQVGQAGDPKCG